MGKCSFLSKIRILIALLFLLTITTGCGWLNPYDDHPLTMSFAYPGMPETPQEAYFDSKHNINPAIFDKKWIKKRKEYEKKYCRVIEARAKAAGVIPENATLCSPEKNSTRKSLKRRKPNGKGFIRKNVKEENDVEEKNIPGNIAIIPDKTGKEQLAYGYRESVFKAIKETIEKPPVPMVIPPKTVRVLILPSSLQDTDGYDMLVSSFYVYFFLDKPRWILHKLPETVTQEEELPADYLILKNKGEVHAR